jgi:DNA-binding MarR family transcriptional regulator
MTRSAVETRQAVASEIRSLVFRMRRAVRNRVRASGEHELPAAQAEVLRLVHADPGMRVQDVADRLGIAANTASTLVGQLGSAGLIERGRDATDARVARLYLTAAAKARIARARDLGATIIGEALERLPAEDRSVITSATPALGRLLDALEAPAERSQ